MRRTGLIDRNNSHKMCLSRGLAEPAGPPGDRESATDRDELWGYSPTLPRRETIDVHDKLIAIGGSIHFEPLSTAVPSNVHHAHLSESAQMRRLTRTGRGTLMRIVAAERTPIGPVLLQAGLVICYNGPHDVDPQSLEIGHERSLPVPM